MSQRLNLKKYVEGWSAPKCRAYLASRGVVTHHTDSVESLRDMALGVAWDRRDLNVVVTASTDGTVTVRTETVVNLNYRNVRKKLGFFTRLINLVMGRGYA